MPRTYTRRFRVRHYELDSLGHVNNAVFANYLEQAAIEASADVGYDAAWYGVQKTGWVIRKLWIKCLGQAYAGDELEVKTWVSDLRRVQSHREYDMRCVDDGKRVVRARANWVYLDSRTLRPARIPEEFGESFMPANTLPLLRILPTGLKPVDTKLHSVFRRTVQRYELDTWGHVNHANYLRWSEQAIFACMANVGYPAVRMREQGWLILSMGHEIEYFRPAYDGDEIEIDVWVSHVGRVRSAWMVEMRDPQTSALLTRGVTLGAFVTMEGHPVPAPESLLAALTDGEG